eukprot:gene7675-biopygen14300
MHAERGRRLPGVHLYISLVFLRVANECALGSGGHG